MKEKINLFWQKSEKWLDSKAFRVYTALVSHNGLVRQKEEYAGGGWTGQTEKFVKNATEIGPGMARTESAEERPQAQA